MRMMVRKKKKKKKTRGSEVNLYYLKKLATNLNKLAAVWYR